MEDINFSFRYVRLIENKFSRYEICHMCSKPATWKRGPLMWMLPLYLHINQKSVDDDDDDDDDDGMIKTKSNNVLYKSL